MKQEILEIYIKTGYCVKISREGDWCKALYPKNILLDLDEDTHYYQIKDDIVTYKYQDKSKEVKVDNYVARILVVADMSIKAMNRKLISGLLIPFKDDKALDGNKLLGLIGPLPFDLVREHLLRDIVYDEIKTADKDYVKAMGIDNGYHAMLTLIESNGLKI